MAANEQGENEDFSKMPLSDRLEHKVPFERVPFFFSTGN